MLKGKAKIDFEKWYLEPKQKRTYKTTSNKGGDKAIILNWYSLSDAHRYGVIVDWFDSVGVNIGKIGKAYKGYYHIHKYCLQEFDTRQKARQKAIEKAFEIYNENN